MGHWDGGGQGEELSQQGREGVVLAGSPGEHPRHSQLSLDGLQKCPGKTRERQSRQRQLRVQRHKRRKRAGARGKPPNLVGEVQVGLVGRGWTGLRGEQGPLGGLCLSPWTLGVASAGHRNH